MDIALQHPDPDHVPQVAQIWRDGWHDAHAEIVPATLRNLRTDESFLTRTKKNQDNISVAVTGADVLGFCMIQGNELYQMYVSERARGTGVAQLLITDAETRILQAGHDKAWLACAVGNARAMRFYEKSGWLNAGLETVNLDTSDGDFPLEIWRYEKILNA